MTFSGTCWRLRLVVLVIGASLPSGCARVASDSARVAVCPPVVDYGAGVQLQAAAELDLLPGGSAVEALLADYAVMRDQARGCATGRSH
jgi:hypothetical protein